MKLKWEVYRHDINKREIVEFNIFDHWRFEEDVKKDLKKCKTKKEFAEKLNGMWVCPDVGSKIDIYSQVMLNFEIFVDYAWSYKKTKSN